MINTTVSHYHILERLGGGGMGVVYKARDLRLNSFVALKFLPAEFSLNLNAKKRFIHEAQAAAALDHQNICVIHDIDESEDRQIFICMNFYEGETLKKRLERGLPAFKEAIGIGIQIARGLHRAHEAGIVHRDIKPANIMLTKRGEVKIVDFGLAKLAGQSRLTKTHGLVGTLSYMSPEQTRGEEVDARADIWALGVLLYELVSGKNPFQADYEAAVLYSILNEDVTPPSSVNPEVNQEMDAVILRALQKNAADRFDSMQDMLSALIHCTGSTTETKQIAPLQQKKFLSRFNLSRPVRIISAFVIFIAIMVSSYLIWVKTDHQPVTVFIRNFENKTTNFRDASVVSDLLADKLDQSRNVKILSKARIAGLCMQLGIDSITTESAFEIARAAGIQFLIQGDMLEFGSILRLNVRAFDVASKNRLFSWEQEGQDSRALLRMINDITSDIRSDLPDLPFTAYPNKTDVPEEYSPSMEANALFMLGKEYYYEDQTKAIACFEQAIAVDSAFLLPYPQLAILCDFLGSTERALVYARRAKQLAGKNHSREYLKTLAVEAWIERNWDNSIDYYRRYIELQPNDLHSMQRLGYILMRNKKEYDQALQIFNNVLQLDPENLSGRRGPNYNYIGIAYQHKGNLPAALDAFEKHREFYPEKADPLNSLGAAYQYCGQYDKAIEYHTAAININPNFFYSYKDLGLVYLSLGRWREALVQFKRYMSALPTDPLNDAHLHMAAVNLIQENYAIAQYEIDQAGKNKNECIRSCWLEGLTALHEKNDIGQAQKMIIDMETALKNDPAAHDDIAYMYHLKARVALAGGDTTTALYLLRRAVEFSQWDEFFFRKELLKGMLECGNFKQVIEEGGHLARINEHDAEVQVILGRAQSHLGNLKQATEHFAKAQTVWRHADSDFLPLIRLKKLLHESTHSR